MRDAKGTGGTAGAAAAVRREALHSTVSTPRRGKRGRGGRREAYLLVVAAGVDGVGDVDGHRVGLVGVGSRVRGATTIWYSNLITHDVSRPRFFGSSPRAVSPSLLRILAGNSEASSDPPRTRDRCRIPPRPGHIDPRLRILANLVIAVGASLASSVRASASRVASARRRLPRPGQHRTSNNVFVIGALREATCSRSAHA